MKLITSLFSPKRFLIAFMIVVWDFLCGRLFATNVVIIWSSKSLKGFQCFFLFSFYDIKLIRYDR